MYGRKKNVEEERKLCAAVASKEREKKINNDCGKKGDFQSKTRP